MPTSPPQVRVPTIAPIEAFRKYHGCASPPEPSGERRPAEQSSDNKGKDAHRELLSGPESGRHAAARRLAERGLGGWLPHRWFWRIACEGTCAGRKSGSSYDGI